jgi:hypothetical protein
MHNFLFQQGHRSIHPNEVVWLAENETMIYLYIMTTCKKNLEDIKESESVNQRTTDKTKAKQ